MRVINFSGGRTSALMTILLKPTAEDIVLFTDTGREHKKTYEFIDNFERFEAIKIHRATYLNNRAPGLFGFEAMTAVKNYLPNRVKRICTVELKILTAKRYLRSLGVQKFDQFIGFRYDEQNRIKDHKEHYKKVKTHFPLNQLKITKPIVLDYWTKKPYNLEIPPILGNCDLCFLKGKNAIIRILQQYPELALPWIKDEENKKASFFPDITYKQLLYIANSQKSLFDLEPLSPAFSCSCNSF